MADEPTIKLKALPWAAQINGRKHLNGERYGVTLTGACVIKSNEESVKVYNFLREVADHLEKENREMQYPDSIRLTLFPPGSAEILLD